MAAGVHWEGRARPLSRFLRVPAAQAWDYPELEIGRTGNSIPALLFDLDRDPFEWLDDIWQGDVPRPNWIVWRPKNMHAHVCYTLERPVLTGEQTRRIPQRWLARVGEWLGSTLRADRGYNSTLSHNPMSRGHRGRYQTEWLRGEPYSLAELGEYVPTGWRRPIKQPLTVYGRNCTLFEAGMRFSGKPRNWGKWVALETHLWAMNAGFIEPLNARELAGIVKSIIRYQRRNLENGQQERFAFIQSARGRRSGAKRREGTPLEHDRTPWETAGISRATWYRHEAGLHIGRHGGDRRSTNFK